MILLLYEKKFPLYNNISTSINQEKINKYIAKN